MAQNAKPGGRTKTLRFRVTAEEEEHAKAAAQDAGFKKLSDYLRAVCFARAVVALNGVDIVVIPSAGTTKAKDGELVEMIERAVASVRSELAGDDEGRAQPPAPSSDPAPTSPSEGGQGDEPPQEPPDSGGRATAAAGSTPGSGETGAAAASTTQDANPPESVGGAAAAPQEAGGVGSPPMPQAPSASYERFPPDTPIPPGTPRLVVPPSAEVGAPGEFWLGRSTATGALFVAVVGEPMAPVPPPAAPHPLDAIGASPAPQPPAPDAPPSDPGPVNEVGETFASYVARRAGELQQEGRPPVVAQQEAAAEWRRQNA